MGRDPLNHAYTHAHVGRAGPFKPCLHTRPRGPGGTLFPPVPTPIFTPAGSGRDFCPWLWEGRSSWGGGGALLGDMNYSEVFTRFLFKHDTKSEKRKTMYNVHNTPSLLSQIEKWIDPALPKKNTRPSITDVY